MLFTLSYNPKNEDERVTAKVGVVMTEKEGPASQKERGLKKAVKKKGMGWGIHVQGSKGR